MTTYDVFLYAGEAEMADLRVRTLAPAGVESIAVSCDRTYQGDPAGTMIEPPGVADWLWVHATPNPDGTRGFHVEHQHRVGVTEAVRTFARADDLVLVSDVDEIPDPARLAEVRSLAMSGSWVSLRQRMHGFALDYLLDRDWYGTTAAMAVNVDAAGQRNVTAPTGSVVHEAGWHLSWLGTPAQRARKLATFTHIELAGLDTEACYRDARHANGEALRRLDRPQMAALVWPQPFYDAWPVPDCWWAPGSLGGR